MNVISELEWMSVSRNGSVLFYLLIYIFRGLEKIFEKRE